MNEENKINYYAIIPATVRYDKELKPAEKLLYGEITSLSNQNGYCYAQNKYFAELYNVTNGTVSKWLSHLQKLNYIKIEIKRNEKQEIIARHIYIMDIPYGQKKPYPYGQKYQYPMVKNDIENIINNNIDDLFNLIIDNSSEIPRDFYLVLENLEFIYTLDILSRMQEDKIQILKNIIYVLFEIYNSQFRVILSKVERKTLINLYLIAEEHIPEDLLNYYKKSIINKYT